MAAKLPCPYCSQAIALEDDAPGDSCPACRRSLLVAYRYRLVAFRGKIAGGLLYEANDAGFSGKVAVLFIEQSNDRAAVARFAEGNRLFSDFAGRGVIKIHQVGGVHEVRPYVVMDWLAGSTLDRRVGGQGQLPPTEVIDLTHNLLTGLSYAHRSIPSVVHGNIHPGKIGFLQPNGQAVLFGFEWAEQVLDQDSRLADAFVDGAGEKRHRTDRAGDLRQLAVSIYYAATGEWIADRGLTDQQALVRQRTPGPLGILLERMLLAGRGGYHSAVEARIDFEQLLEGDQNWQPRVRPVDHDEPSNDWAPAETARADFYSNEAFSLTDEDDDDDDELDDDE
ncbi:MAG: hypothetical protein KC431_26465, partial [Myxococcales bacterium]|nr:hypothetical protein [Myxococcales bacterium]